MTISRLTDTIIIRQVILMMINEIMEKRNLSKYRLSKNSGIPYTTLTDIINGKAQLEKCSAETVYKLSRELNIPMEELLSPYLEKRCSFELFKSNVCHKLKELGDIDFMIDTLESNKIREYYNRRWYPESFYLLAMLDYISRINGVPMCEEYSDLRRQSLQDVLYPSGVIAEAAVADSENAKQKAKMEVIPEFMRFNIVENEVRNVI